MEYTFEIIGGSVLRITCLNTDDSSILYIVIPVLTDGGGNGYIMESYSVNTILTAYWSFSFSQFSAVNNQIPAGQFFGSGSLSPASDMNSINNSIFNQVNTPSAMPAVTITPSNNEEYNNPSLQGVCAAFFGIGTVGTWSTDNILVAIPSAQGGAITGTAPGTCNITFTKNGVSGSVGLTLRPENISGAVSVPVAGNIILTSSPAGGTWLNADPTKSSFVDNLDGTCTVTGIAPGADSYTYTVNLIASTAHNITVV